MVLYFTHPARFWDSFILQTFTEKVLPAESCARHQDTKDPAATLKKRTRYWRRQTRGYNTERWGPAERKPRAAWERHTASPGLRVGFLGEAVSELGPGGCKGERWENVLGGGRDAARHGRGATRGPGLEEPRGQEGSARGRPWAAQAVWILPQCYKQRGETSDVHFKVTPSRTAGKKGQAGDRQAGNVPRPTELKVNSLL